VVNGKFHRCSFNYIHHIFYLTRQVRQTFQEMDVSYMGRKLKFLLNGTVQFTVVFFQSAQRQRGTATGLIHSPLKVNNVLTFSNLALICHPEGSIDKM
jgi:hypothetical protein